MVKTSVFRAGKGRFRIELWATITKEGLVVQIYGGEKAHVGAIALSIPRPGLADPEKISCNTTVVPLLGHKDDEIARPIAEEIAKTWRCPVVVVAGIHIDGAGKEDVEMLTNNCWTAARKLIDVIKA
ncbi:MAG: hypothetical protein HPY89_08055 [Pelotomaculum sp.]|uniref:Prenylated flavin chaperone LpdD-like domain-containing protein n=1 Tax=Pelotomaculum thermopropionicum (strain DSM 13744 / JCM 10971 / SI) TaxID=370438 RepID=A5D2C8_PELTS|nr:hypothetical protein [Pelotomaculum sp.]BAF59607.1 hypothetical protein PTH_1426 [Pelotomaculum thermopropionicum SI]